MRFAFPLRPLHRFALSLLAAVAGFALLSSAVARAGDWCAALSYGGHQPWWNMCAHHRNQCLTCEEKRLNHFWHDYYDSTRRYYTMLSHVDWVSYYKNHGTPNYTPTGCTGQGIISYVPVFVSPTMQCLQPNCEPFCAYPTCNP